METKKRSRKSAIALAGGVLLAAPTFAATASAASAPVKLSDSQAAARLSKAGIQRTSSGHCTSRSNKRCTSYDQIRTVTVNGVTNFKNASKCKVTITGGTETGHSNNGLHTHWNGFKVDLAKSDCVNRYIKSHYKYIGLRGDGYPQWRSPSGNVYCDEYKLNHWDVYYVHSNN